MFGKEGDYIDYTLLKKRGLLRAGSDRSVGNDAVVDMTSLSSSPSMSSSSSSSSFNSSSGSPFDMLNSLASTSSGSESSSSFSSSSENSDLGALKLKIEDIEYKLERLIDRISVLDSKMSELGR